MHSILLLALVYICTTYGMSKSPQGHLAHLRTWYHMLFFSVHLIILFFSLKNLTLSLGMKLTSLENSKLSDSNYNNAIQSQSSSSMNNLKYQKRKLKVTKFLYISFFFLELRLIFGWRRQFQSVRNFDASKGGARNSKPEARRKDLETEVHLKRFLTLRQTINTQDETFCF